MKKDIFKSVMLALCMLVSFYANAHDFEVDGIYYNILTTTEVEVTFKGSYSSEFSDEYTGKVEIPESISYNGSTNSVTSIGTFAFAGCTGLTSITIPNSVTSIGTSAFGGCTGLTSITIPNSVTSIGGAAFRGCTGLTSITIPNSVTSIGNSAFGGCTGLTSITVDDGNAVYDSRENCNAIIEKETNSLILGCKNTVIPNSVTSIGYESFVDCTGLTSVTIPNSVTSIVDFAFRGCTGLASITIPNSVTSIGGAAFRGCTGLTSITIPNSVTSIGTDAFFGCTGLTSITVDDGNAVYDSRENCNAIIEKETNSLIVGCKNTVIPNSVTSIGDYAFYDCTGLASITIPNSVTSIGDYAFYDCTGLASITIPNSVTSIESGVFRGCTGLASITIPNSVTSIGYGSFAGCTGLTCITIPNSVTSIGTGAFFGCTGLISVTIPNSVTSIGYESFVGCTGLTSITIPNSVTSIGYYAFDSCTGLKTVINCSSLDISTGSSGHGYVAYYADKVITADEQIGDFIFKDMELVAYTGNDKEVKLPNNYNGGNYTIGHDAFYGCTGLTSITIPNSVTSIGGSAFYGCTGLTSITIPNSVTSNPINLGSAFSGCTGLACITVDDGNAVYDSRENCNAIIEKETNSLILGCKNTTIPNSVTSIGGQAFFGCTGLTSITIPNSVTSIGGAAFDGCTGLTSITIPNSVTSIEMGAFFGCTGLTSITIPNSVTSIEDFAFFGCTGLTSITIPNSVTSIGGDAFEGCTGLASITIPNSVTSIGELAFDGCTGLKTVINCSSLDISAGSSLHGNVAYYADKVITADEQIGDFIFKDMELVAYTGNDKEVKLPNNYKGGNYTIGNDAFMDCIGLTSITIPNSVTSIGTGAFFGCTGLTSITIPNSVTSIGECAFSSCTGLASITVGDGNAVYDSRENCNAIIEKETNSLIFGCKNTVIPNSVTSIGDDAFYGCDCPTSITIPNSVTSIGRCAFYGCDCLTSITIPNSVTSIGELAFSYCTGLASITVDDGNAVYDSRENCNAIIEKETNSLILGCKNTTIPNSVTSIGGAAFYGCDCLTSITIPNSVTSIGDYAFYGCTGLTSITIPNSVTSIGGAAFYGCDCLTSITIPNSVTSIGDYAFYDCISLSEIYSYMENPCACPSNSDGSPTLYVPAGTADKYIAQGWDNWVSEIVEVEIEISNTLSVSDVKVTHGASVILPVSMENEESVTAFQFEVSLPEGVSLVGCELTDRKSDQTLSFSELPNGNYQVVALSLTSKAFKDSEGALVNLQLATEKEMEAGEYNVTVKNIELTTTDEDALRPADCTAKLTVTDVMVGDSNGDGKISITDAVAIVNYILNKPSSNFAVEAADVNMDAKVTITDAVAIVNKILAGTTEAKSRAADMQLDPQ